MRKLFKVGKLFKGGNYSRAETIRGNTVSGILLHCCYLRASVGIAMAILPLEGIYPQIKRAKVLFKTKTNNLPLICNSIFQTGRQCL